MLSIVFSKVKRLLLINCKEDPQQIFSQKRLCRGKSPITPLSYKNVYVGEVPKYNNKPCRNKEDVMNIY